MSSHGTQVREEKSQDSKGARYPEWTAAQRLAISEELERILADPIFSGSKRCIDLLRSLTEHVLSGNYDSLKERSLGVEVFGRNASYDTADDPIVRRFANEIRKRLAQWYQKSDYYHAVRIRLVPGSYLPEFDFDYQDQPYSTGDREGIEESGEPIKPQPGILSGTSPELARARLLRKWLLFGAYALVILAAVVVLYHVDAFRSTQYLIWKPLLDSKEPITICVSDNASLVGVTEKDRAKSINDTIASRQLPPSSRPPDFAPTTRFVDALAAHRISNWLAMYGRNASLRPSSELTWRIIGQGPLVLVGAYSNPWSLILLSDLRFSVRMDPVTYDKWIQDSQDLSKRDWKINEAQGSNAANYELITRYLDPETGNWIIAIEGFRWQSTANLSSLLINPSLARALPSSLRSAKNFQVVVRSSIVNGNATSPQVLAVHTW
jgi:hypothetical protein